MLHFRTARTALLVCVLLATPSCASHQPPDVAIAQTTGDIVEAATQLQSAVNSATAARALPVALGQKITDANKVVSAKAAQLSAALKTYHAATTLGEKQDRAAKVQALITELSEPLSQMLGVQLPEGVAASISRAIGQVMQTLGAIQTEIAKGLG